MQERQTGAVDKIYLAWYRRQVNIASIRETAIVAQSHTTAISSWIRFIRRSVPQRLSTYREASKVILKLILQQLQYLWTVSVLLSSPLYNCTSISIIPYTRNTYRKRSMYWRIAQTSCTKRHDNVYMRPNYTFPIDRIIVSCYSWHKQIKGLWTNQHRSTAITASKHQTTKIATYILLKQTVNAKYLMQRNESKNNWEIWRKQTLQSLVRSLMLSARLYGPQLVPATRIDKLKSYWQTVSR